jgi:hypothetical protein
VNGRAPVAGSADVGCLHRALKVKETTSWAEREATKQGNPKEAARREELIREELRKMNEHLVVARRTRLQALYAAEMGGWEIELARKGLAVERPTV